LRFSYCRFKIRKFFNSETTRGYFIIAITIILAVLNYLLFEITSKSVNLVKDSVAEMKKADSIAESALELSKKNFIIENRAWVGLDNVTNEDMLRIKNFGKTPAEDIWIGQKQFKSFTNFPTRPRINSIDFKKIGTLSPTENRHVEFLGITIPQNPADGEYVIEKVRGKNVLYCLYGVIVYRDIYGGRDTTEFSFIADTVGHYGFLPFVINGMK